MSRTERRHPWLYGDWARDGVTRCPSGRNCEICGSAAARRENRRARRVARKEVYREAAVDDGGTWDEGECGACGYRPGGPVYKAPCEDCPQI